MTRRGAVAWLPYQVMMIGRDAPFAGDRVEGSAHHVLRHAVEAAEHWCRSIESLGCDPVWPYYWAVIDVRDGSEIYRIVCTEEFFYGKNTRPRARPNRYR